MKKFDSSQMRQLELTVNQILDILEEKTDINSIRFFVDEIGLIARNINPSNEPTFSEEAVSKAKTKLIDLLEHEDMTVRGKAHYHAIHINLSGSQLEYKLRHFSERKSNKQLVAENQRRKNRNY